MTGNSRKLPRLGSEVNMGVNFQLFENHRFNVFWLLEKKLCSRNQFDVSV